MPDIARDLIRALPDRPALIRFARHARVTFDPEQILTPLRVRALLRAAGLLDEALLREFGLALAQDNGLRLALYDLFGKRMPDELAPLPAGAPAEDEDFCWLCLALAVHADGQRYPLEQFDPASPPQLHTPAGLVLQQTVQFMRKQTSRTATERDRLARKLAFDPAAAPSLEQLPAADTAAIPPVPPYYRFPIPVRYPEYNPPLDVRPDELAEPANHHESTPPPARQAPLSITHDDLPRPERQPPVTISPEQLPAEPPPTRAPAGRVQPQTRPTNSIAHSLRQMFKSETFKKTRLRVVVQEQPDGPGLYGLQVVVTCRGIRSYVAGTTDRQGRFVCELPVRLHNGLTYDVEVTWPRDLGGETEKKAVTLNADRTEFTLPFYRRLQV